MAEEFDDLALGNTIRGYAGGQRLFGRFVLKRILGRGGMGMVWLAWDERLEREVALKFLPDLLRADEAALDDLKRETRRGLDLAHPHIVRVYDLVEEPNAAAIAMEFVDGQTLSSFRVSRPQKFFEVPEIAQWVRQLCEALDYAHHRAKVVHRDLKPANLMINGESDIKVTDFGIARSISDSVSRVTQDRGTSGTLLYMSPQQALGKRPAISDDIYALGATLYELLTSKPPFFSGNIARQLDEVDPPSMTERRQELELSGGEIPPEWEATIKACLAKDPAQRPQEATEVSERLGLNTGTRISYAGASASMAGTSAGASAPGGAATAAGATRGAGASVAGMTAAGATVGGTLTPETGKSSKTLLLIALAAILLLGGGLGVLLWQRQQGEAERKAKEEQTRLAQEQRDRELAANNNSGATADARKKAEAEAAAKFAEEKRLQEEEARAKAGPQVLVVPDQHRKIQAAMDVAKSGDTIQLKPGRYVEAVKFKDGVKLVAMEPDKTRLEAPNAKDTEAIIWVENCRTGSIEGLSLVGNGLEVDGIMIFNSKIQVTNCRVESCGGSGIAVKGTSSAPELKGNRCRENGRMGIFFLDGARGLAEGNVCEANTLSGIAALSGGTNPLIRKNECRGNKKHGIETSYNAGGTAEENLCEHNDGGGIVVTSVGTVTTLLRNICRGNRQSGINFGNGAGGRAENNVCEENNGSGALVFESATPELIGNQLRRNKLNGIQFAKQSKGVADGNTIESNEECGIIVSDPQTRPTIRNNRISKNKQWGLAVINGADPIVDPSNKFSENVVGAQTKR